MDTFFGTRCSIASITWLACTSETVTIVSAYGVTMTTVLIELAFVDIFTRLPVTTVAWVACTGVATVCVRALGI